MTPDQQAVVNSIRAKAKGAKTKFEMLAVLMRLRQAANHLALLKEQSDDPSGKLETFFELLDEAMDGGHRVLVFSQFVSMLSILRRELERQKIPYCYLDGSTKDRLGECRKFNQSDIPVFLISLHAGGTGLNLVGADTVIHFDPWWNPAVENQATDRAHRIGQKKKVCVVKLISEDSVEERVLKLQEKKSLVIDATVGATDEAVGSKLTFDDLRSVIGL
jgi:SNF2 family DNA or RNA helicase